MTMNSNSPFRKLLRIPMMVFVALAFICTIELSQAAEVQPDSVNAKRLAKQVAHNKKVEVMKKNQKQRYREVLTSAKEGKGPLHVTESDLIDLGVPKHKINEKKNVTKSMKFDIAIVITFMAGIFTLLLLLKKLVKRRKKSQIR